MIDRTPDRLPNPPGSYTDAAMQVWAEEALRQLQDLRAARSPQTRSGRKIRRLLERLGQ